MRIRRCIVSSLAAMALVLFAGACGDGGDSRESTQQVGIWVESLDDGEVFSVEGQNDAQPPTHITDCYADGACYENNRLMFADDGDATGYFTSQEDRHLESLTVDLMVDADSPETEGILIVAEAVDVPNGYEMGAEIFRTEPHTSDDERIAFELDDFEPSE